MVRILTVGEAREARGEAETTSGDFSSDFDDRCGKRKQLGDDVKDKELVERC